MTIRFMFHILAILTVMLTFSMPFATLAQQQSTPTEISEILEIKAAAEQDATNDINDLLWFGVGLGIAYVAGGCGGLAGWAVGDEINSSDFVPYGPGEGGTIGLLIGATAGILTSINLICKSPVHVPAGRLIGKSPEYVELYTDAYQRKMQSLQTKWAITGAGIGCALPIIGCIVILSP